MIHDGHFFRELIEVFAPLVKHLIDAIFRTRTWPRMFKVHATRLIRKAGIRLAAVVKDLRPISIIPPLAKVVEKLWY